MESDHTLNAVYAPPSPGFYALSVNSLNPATGVAVLVSPADKNGAGNGTTAFTRSYAAAAWWPSRRPWP